MELVVRWIEFTNLFFSRTAVTWLRRLTSFPSLTSFCSYINDPFHRLDHSFQFEPLNMARPRIAVLFLVFAIGVVLAKPAEEKYTTKYDNVDVNEILNNPRLFTNYVNCLLDKGNCTPEGKELKGMYFIYLLLFPNININLLFIICPIPSIISNMHS